MNGIKECRKSIVMKRVAVWTRLELATSAVTGRHSNQLNYQTFIKSAKVGYFFHFSKTFYSSSTNTPFSATE